MRQSFHDWKVFCIDDKSTDRTASVIKNYSNKDNRIKYVERCREPKGAQTCRNLGIEMSKGAEYIIWFDSDDIIAPYCFEQRVTYMDNHPELDFSVFKAISFYDGSNKIDSLYGFEYSSINDLKRFIRRPIPFAVWTNIYRRDSVLEKKLVWDEKVLSLQDSDFNIQSLLKGMRYDYSKGTLVDYFWRINQASGSISKNIISDAHKKSHLYFIKKLYDSIPRSQKKKMKVELDDNLFFFIDKFYDDVDFLEAIFTNEWMLHRVWFRKRIEMYCRLNKRYKSILFPVIVNYRRIYDFKCRISRKLQMRESLKKISTYKGILPF